MSFARASGGEAVVAGGGIATAWLQRQCACGGGTGCAGCDDDEGLHKKAAVPIGAMDDPLEHEANRAAEQALAGRAVRLGAGGPPEPGARRWADERAGPAPLAKRWKLYWANGSRLIASWGSPDRNKTRLRGAIGSRGMTDSTTLGAVVEKKSPAPSGSSRGSGGSKTGGLDLLPGRDVEPSSMPSVIGGDRSGDRLGSRLENPA
jgi:hypothetical protein